MTSKDFFQKLNADTVHLVSEFYHPEAEFHDPLGSLRGVEALKGYYKNLYAGAQAVSFSFQGQLVQGSEEVLFWEMTLQSKSLNQGKPYSVVGNSHFRFDPKTGLCVYHRDYFDMGAFVYERIPVLSHLVGWIKGRLKRP